MKIAVLNQKGGVGKTTVSVNLAYGLADAGKRTLLVDLDPQAHASVIYCPEIPAKERTIGDIFDRRDSDLASLVQPAMVSEQPVEQLAIVPSSIHLAVTAERMISQHYRERRLHAKLGAVAEQYDVVVLDCPPNLGVITVNAIYTADLILIPTTYGRYSLDGIADLFSTIQEIKEGQGRFAILRNAFDARTKQTNQYIETQLEAVKEHVLDTIIRKTEAINQAQIKGEPIFTFDPSGHGTADFKALTQELLSHGG